MDSTHLADQQLASLKAVVGRHLRYLGRMQKRMDAVGWKTDDAVYLAALKAYSGVHALNVELHYLSVKGGVGR